MPSVLMRGRTYLIHVGEASHREVFSVDKDSQELLRASSFFAAKFGEKKRVIKLPT